MGEVYTTILSRYRVLWHTLFWFWLYILDVLIFGTAYQHVDRFLIYAMVEMPGQILFAYAVIYWILPRYFAKKRYVETIIFVVSLFFFIGVMCHGIAWILSFYDTPYAGGTGWWTLPKIALASFYCFLKACIFIAIKLVMLWYENERRVTEMEKSRLQSELKMLKDQVNPHFMFNTLNNLYGLIRTNPVHAQESVLGLSDILHYMLYESNYDTIPLQREIKCLHDYIALEKLRYPGNLAVSINVQQQVQHLSILPLSLFPFVENSFKHGASELIKDAWVNIDISAYKKDFIFKIENSKQPYAKENSNGHGIGLSNAKRRLELIYQHDHSLQIIDSEDRYLVILKIALSRLNTTNIAEYENEVSYR